jgi:formamidopyrimidine-DNA glycosylase
MDPEVVVGVGNIYATEALFRARIDPRRPAGRISLARYEALVGHVQDVLREGIAKGGSTLRDFHGIQGEIGTFPESVQAYGRAGQPCVSCGRALSQVRLGGRSSVFCAHCQR